LSAASSTDFCTAGVKVPTSCVPPPPGWVAHCSSVIDAASALSASSAVCASLKFTTTD
jgi:hypothetical protein